MVKVRYEKKCKYPSIPDVHKPLRLVSLQITTNVQHHYSDDIDDKTFYDTQKNAEMLCNQPSGDILPENFFKKARKAARDSLGHKKFGFDVAKQDYINQVGNIVGILGEAGMGKTTLLTSVLEEILNENANPYNAECVFYLKFEELNYVSETTFLHFLTSSSIPSRFTEHQTMMKKFLDELNENDHVCVIMDGFDHADLRSDFARVSKLNINDRAVPKDFLGNLMQGKILIKAKKIISSRPR